MNRSLLGVLRSVRARADGGPAGEPSPALEGLDSADRQIVERVLPYTMTGPARVQAVLDAVRYCVRRPVPGAFAECGVWRGGSVLAMILALQDMGVTDRDIHLYDTFEGMTTPTEHDTSAHEKPALETWKHARRHGDRAWPQVFGGDVYDEGAVLDLLLATGYPAERLHVVKGPVEQTVPEHAPPGLALLRLDTDWYESTRHEMHHLYPRVSDGGVLIIDDYGHWDGARRAIDEYFAEHAQPLLLNRTDYTGRVAVKH